LIDESKVTARWTCFKQIVLHAIITHRIELIKNEMYPADGVGILAMRVGELGGTPARDGFSHKLSRGHEEGEADENE
jgi:hypothetical protein